MHSMFVRTALKVMAMVMARMKKVNDHQTNLTIMVTMMMTKGMLSV